MDRIGELLSAAICITLGVCAVWFVHSTGALGERALAIPIKVWPIRLVLRVPREGLVPVLAVAKGFDPIHFGIVLNAKLEVGCLTPPVGLVGR